MKSEDFLSGRLWLKMVGLMALTPLIGPIWDFFGEIMLGFGSVSNLTLILIPIILILFAMNAVYLIRSSASAYLALCLSLALIIFARTVMDAQADAYGVVGSSIMVCMVLSGLLAFAVSSRGVDVSGALVGVICTTAVFLPLPLLLVSARPDAFDPYYLNVYGYSNVRVLGYFASTAAVAWMLRMSFHIRDGNGTMTFVCVVLGTISWSILAWSGSRAGILAAVVAMTFSWLVISWPGLKAFFAAAISFAAGMSLSLMFHHPDEEFGIASRVAKTALGFEEGDMRILTSNRTDLWMWAWDLIMEQPLIGHGLYAMSHLRTPEFNFMHTHNVFLEYFLAVGLVLGGIVALTVFALFCKAGRAARTSARMEDVVIFGVMTTTALTAQFSAALFFPFHTMIFLMGVGGLLGINQVSRAKS